MCISHSLPLVKSPLLSGFPSLAPMQQSMGACDVLVGVSDIKKGDFYKRTADYMRFFCEQEDVLYPSDAYVKYPRLSDEKMLAYFKDIRFALKPGTFGFVYHPVEGGNFARDLRQLSLSPFLILDCGVSLVIAHLLAVVDVIGEPALNRIVENKCGTKSFEIDHRFLQMFCIREPQKSCKKSYSAGDHIYVDAGDEARLFHPASNWNGYHLFCVVGGDKDTARFIGFSSTEEPPKKLSEIISSMNDHRQSALTYMDLYRIYHGFLEETADPECPSGVYRNVVGALSSANRGRDVLGSMEEACKRISSSKGMFELSDVLMPVFRRPSVIKIVFSSRMALPAEM